jgi:hypothetical protein
LFVSWAQFSTMLRKALDFGDLYEFVKRNELFQDSGDFPLDPRPRPVVSNTVNEIEIDDWSNQDIDLRPSFRR